jgi:hypothetical protein
MKLGFLKNGSKTILNDIVDNGAFPHGNIKKGMSPVCPHQVIKLVTNVGS